MPDPVIEVNPSPWEKLTAWFGGKSHFSFLAAYVVITAAFYLHNGSTNFPVFSGSILSLCGFQHWRSISQDKTDEDK
jgi:hypothetical protein